MKMKFKRGDLIAEYMTDESIYLIVLTEVRGNLGHGFIIDSIHNDEEWVSEGCEELIDTKEDGGENYIQLKDVVLIQSGYTEM